MQEGDPQAVSLLLSQNEGYSTMLARSCFEQFSQHFLVDDLKQEEALALLEEYRTVFQIEPLGECFFDLGYGDDPARAYDRFMRRTLLFQRMEEVLKPRELSLVRVYLGIGQPNEQGMTFQELAIRLNYNDPSGAEKAYKSTIRKLGKHWGRCMRPVVHCPESDPSRTPGGLRGKGIQFSSDYMA